MSRDETLATILVVSFAILVTAHVTIVAGLALRRPRWRALFALVVLPYAPVCGWREKMTVRSVAWVVAAVAYAVTRGMASR